MATATATMGLIKPDTNDKTEDTIEALAENFDQIDKAISWVGMIVQSTRQIDPAEIYGGTWTPLQGRVLVGAGTDFTAGTTGGAARHKHQKGSPVTTAAGSSGSYVIGGGNDTLEASSMPPYRAVYMWERTA